MKIASVRSACLLAILVLTLSVFAGQAPETAGQHDARMQWWREARFGLFIHWGLYAIPAGEWGGKTNYGEWIRNNAQIPLPTYDSLWPSSTRSSSMPRPGFAWPRTLGCSTSSSPRSTTTVSPVRFEVSDFDVTSTPFRRDILKELAEACRKEGISLCFYHSIMDWHHPDYLPRRDWEAELQTGGGISTGTSPT